MEINHLSSLFIFTFIIFLFFIISLIKDYKVRPKYKQLLEHPFLQRYMMKVVNVAEWYMDAISLNNTTK